MGKIKKLQDKGATILPLTVADAVLMNSAEAGNLSTYLEALKSGVDFLLSIIGEDQAGDIFLKTKDGMPRGFYTEGFVSAGGKSATEGGGGANLSQMWESLQNNNDTFKDRLINVAHIPTLTTGKISDFVSATQAIADTAVANKADKDKVVDLTSNQTISGEKSFKMFYGHSSFNILDNVNSVIIKYGETGGWDGGYMIKSGDNTMTTFGVHGANRNPYYAYVALNGEVGNTNPSFKFYEGGKLTHKTLDVQESAHTNLVTNLNADMLDGLHGSEYAKMANLTNYLPLTGGTLTGALTVNAPINNTGALKLLGAGEVSSTGMAVGSGAKALGTQSRALASNSYAGLRTGNSTYPSAVISPYDLLPFTVNGKTVYGTPIKANSTLTYTYNGTSYTVENTTNYTQVLVLITVGSDFVAGVTHPLNKCTLTYNKGQSLGSSRRILAIRDLSDTVRAITIYTSVQAGANETNFINSFVITNSNKFYTYKGVSLSTSSGDSSIASGSNSIASGNYSVASGNYSVASGSNSIASGSNSIASAASSVASGNSSVASGAYSVASGPNSVASGNSSVASGSYSVASGSNSIASGGNSVASHEASKVFATSGISGKAHQTVLGYYNAEDANSVLVVGWGQGETNRKNVFTVDSYGYVRMGNRLHIGVGGQNEVYFNSDVADQLYVHTSAGIPFLIQRDHIRRGSSTPNTTLGTDQYKWFNVFTKSLKIADANLTYDIGTLTIDKALKTTSTLTATQGEFANYVKIGNATISWNPKGYLEINEGLASHKFISAGGVVTGDAGGGAGGLSLTDMWVSLNGNIDAYGKSKIHIDHIPLDVILSHDSYENDVANRINTFNYNNSSSFTSAVKALIIADNIPTLEMPKINGLEYTLTNIGTVVQNNYETLSNLITNNHNDHEARIKALEQALTWQTV